MSEQEWYAWGPRVAGTSHALPPGYPVPPAVQMHPCLTKDNSCGTPWGVRGRDKPPRGLHQWPGRLLVEGQAELSLDIALQQIFQDWRDAWG